MRATVTGLPGRVFFASAIALAAVTASFVLVRAAAVYDHSTPGPSASMQASPGRIDIWTVRATMSTGLLTQIAVTDANLNHYESGPTVVDPVDHRHFWVNVQQQMPAGRYLVYFKTEGEQDFDRDGGMFAIYVGTTPTKADLAADKRLALTTVDGGDEGPISGVERGVVEGGIPAFIFAGGFIWWWQQKRQSQKEFVPLDDRDLSRK
jgi:methionine-rich copper-binding protein CopC